MQPLYDINILQIKFNKMKRKLFSLTAVLVYLALNSIFSQTKPNLGIASDFTLFTAGGAFNEFGISSTVTGNAGTNSGAFSAFPPGILNGNKFTPGSAVAIQASTDVANAYIQLNQGGTVINILLDNLVLTSGVYNTGAASALNSDGILTLNGQGNPNAVFIIRINGALTTGTNSRILLINSALASNVYWQINGQFDLGTNSVFRGTALVNGAINLLENSTLYGRALSQVGAISLHNNVVTLPLHFRSKISGNWNTIETWESSSDSTIWTNAAVLPTTEAISVNITTGNTVTITSNASSSVLTVNAGAKLTLNPEKTLTTNILIIKNNIVDGPGTFINNGLTNVTTCHVQQQLTTGRNWYISSPITNATANFVNSSTGSYMVYYDEIHGSQTPWVTTNSTLTPMKGYIAVSPVNLNPTVTFSGILNNGPQSIAVSRTLGQTKEGFNLIGNPYPSHIAWTKDIAINANTLSTIWYRTKVEESYVFQTYNADDEIGVPSEVTGIVPPMQAFWVRANIGGGTLTLNNSMRSHGESTNRLKSPAANTDKQIVRLQVSNGISSDETVLFFNNKASDDFDTYDSPKMSNNNAAIPEIFTFAGTEKVVINGLKLISPNIEIPLGFMSLSTNNFSIRANEVTNIPLDTKLILIDKYENKEKDLTGGSPYTFKSDVINSIDRFSLIFRSTTIITKNDSESFNLNMLVFVNTSNEITVIYKDVLKENMSITIYNTTGLRIINKQITNNTTTIHQPLQSGIYFVKVKCENQTSIKKIYLSNNRI